MEYIIKPSRIRDIVHSGKGHDDNPPGRGSGRYAWGSGKKGQKKKIKMDPLLDKKIKRGKDKEPVSAAEQLTRNARDTVGDVSSVVKGAADLHQDIKKSKEKERIKSSIKDIPDAELKQKINRLNLEKQYADLSSSDISLGREKLEFALDTSMTVANLAATAASVATTIWFLKKGMAAAAAVI